MRLVGRCIWVFNVQLTASVISGPKHNSSKPQAQSVFTVPYTGEALEKMKQNEPGGRNEKARCPVSRQSVQSYVLTFSRLKKRERLIAPVFPQGEGGGLIYAFAAPHLRQEGWRNTGGSMVAAGEQ